MRTGYLSTILLVLVTAGCGAGSGDGAERAVRACVAASDVTADIGPAAAGNAIAIAAVDDRFDPACVELAEAGPVTLVVRNDGRHPHNLTLPDGGAVSVDAGQVAILATTVPAGGVRYTCTIHPGMDGELRAAR